MLQLYGIKNFGNTTLDNQLPGNVSPLSRSLPFSDEENREKVCQSLEQEKVCLLPGEQAEEVHRLAAGQAPGGQALLCFQG